jgi:hypothetical protein
MYEDYSKSFRYLDELIKMLNTSFNDDILENYVTKEFSQIQDNKNIIEEYSNN